MQQSLPQALPFSLQQAAQLSLQHFSQALPAARAVLERAATEAAAMRVRMVFIVLDVFVFLKCLLLRIPVCGAGMRVPGVPSSGGLNWR